MDDDDVELVNPVLELLNGLPEIDLGEGRVGRVTGGVALVTIALNDGTAPVTISVIGDATSPAEAYGLLALQSKTIASHWKNAGYDYDGDYE